MAFPCILLRLEPDSNRAHFYEWKLNVFQFSQTGGKWSNIKASVLTSLNEEWLNIQNGISFWSHPTESGEMKRKTGRREKGRVRDGNCSSLAHAKLRFSYRISYWILPVARCPSPVAIRRRNKIPTWPRTERLGALTQQKIGSSEIRNHVKSNKRRSSSLSSWSSVRCVYNR